MDTQQCLKTLYEAYIQLGHSGEHQAAIPTKCYIYPIAYWGFKDVVRTQCPAQKSSGNGIGLLMLIVISTGMDDSTLTKRVQT